MFIIIIIIHVMAITPGCTAHRPEEREECVGSEPSWDNSLCNQYQGISSSGGGGFLPRKVLPHVVNYQDVQTKQQQQQQRFVTEVAK